MDPTPFQIFCGYYLGLDKDFRYRFFNLHSLAEHYGIAPERLRFLMSEWHMTPEDVRHVEFNVARAHAEAQKIAASGFREDLERFARSQFEAYCQLLAKYDPRRDFENVDYDNILPEPKSKPPQD